MLFRETPAMQALVNFTRTFLEDAFYPYSPPEIHLHLGHADRADFFAHREREFSQSREVRQLWRTVFECVGLDPTLTARDRLHLRFQPHEDPGSRLPRTRTTATIAFHRDTWGSNLYAQINWWAPVYPISSGRTFAMYPTLWKTSLQNSSSSFDMAAVLERSKTGGRNSVDADQAIPHLLEDVDPALGTPVVIEPGSMVAFSGAHAHAGIPNHTGVTRISFETRTLWIPNVQLGRGAPNVDGHAPWARPSLFRRVSDSKPLNEILALKKLEPFVGPLAAKVA
jgi:hypothetical protein